MFVILAFSETRFELNARDEVQMHSITMKEDAYETDREIVCICKTANDN